MDKLQGSDPPPPAFMIARLSALIFLAFSIMGAWLPVFSLHLKSLQFTPEATSWASATNAIGAVLAPMIWGQIADRWLATERCISLCAVVAGILLCCLVALTDPWPVFLFCVVIWFFLIPILGLTGAYIFRHLEHPERDYGRIRVWGTLGWIAANWLLSGWFAWQRQLDSDFITDTADSLRLGALSAFVFAIYALTMPHAPPVPRQALASQRTWLARLLDAPMTALTLFRNRSFLVYCTCMFGLYVTIPFAIQLNPLLLDRLQVDPSIVPACLTMCQSMEVVALLLLPWLTSRIGGKLTMLVGALAWTTGLYFLSVGTPLAIVFAGFSMSGIFICCFVISGQVFVNRHASDDIRASAQGVLIFINGSGLLAGHLLVGWVRDFTGDRFDIGYLAAAIAATMLTLIFWCGFTAPRLESEP